MARERNKNIDIVKSLAIMMVVLGHCGFPLRNIFSLFHVPLFFIASGFCYNDKHSKSIKNILILIKKRLKQLYVPFVVINIPLILLHNLFIKINLYTLNIDFVSFGMENNFRLAHYYSVREIIRNIINTLLFRNEEELIGAIWFLRVIFAVNILYAINKYILNKFISKQNVKELTHFLLSLIILVIGYFCSLNERLLSFNISSILSSYILFEIGYLIRNIKIKNSRTIVSNSLTVVITFLLLYLYSKISFISLNINKYSSPISLIIISLLGFIFTYCLAEILFLFKGKFLDLILLIGRNTIYILFGHFIAFKAVTYLQLIIYKLPHQYLAAFPTLYTFKIWWFIYFIAGMAFPLLIHKLLKCLGDGFREKYSYN